MSDVINTDDIFSTTEIAESNNAKNIKNFINDGEKQNQKGNYKNIFLPKQYIETQTQKAILINLPFTKGKKYWANKDFTESYSKIGKPYIRFSININDENYIELIDDEKIKKSFPTAKVYEAYEAWEKALIENNWESQGFSADELKNGITTEMYEALRKANEFMILKQDLIKIKQYQKPKAEIATENDEL